MKKMISVLAVLLLLAAAASFITAPMATAEYRVTGKITGQECTSFFVVDKCDNRNIDAVLGDDRKLHHVIDRFKNVDEYKSGRCWIRIKTQKLGVVSRLYDAVTAPSFYEKQKDGQYKKVDVEYITFPCKEH